MKIENIKIHRQVTAEHQKVLLLYLRDETQLSSNQWTILRQSVRLLGRSTLFLDGILYSFRQFYEIFVDARFADEYLGALSNMTDVEQEAPAKQAQVARQILEFLESLSGFRRTELTCQLLLVYNLYWWAF